MKNLRQLLMAACVAGTMSFPAAASADDITTGSSTSIVQAINDFRADIDARIDALATNIQTLFASASNALTASAQQANLATQNPANAFQFTQSADGTSISPLPVYQLVAQSVRQSALDKITASLDPGNQDSQRQVLLQPPTTGDNAVVNMIDMQGLLSPTVYSDPTAQNEAERTVAFFSDYANPLGSIDLTQLSQNPDLQNSRSGQAYQVKIYTESAIRSLLIGNLYQSFSMRQPIKGLGQTSGIPNVNDASLAQVLQYIASRRVSNPSWYDSINKAPPVVVERETAYILAEIEWQLYQLHQDNERMLQTMTAVGILNLRAGKMMTDQDEMQLKQAVEGTGVSAPTTDSFSTTTTTTTPSTTSTSTGVPAVPQ